MNRILFLLLFISSGSFAQFNSKVYYKYNHIDGWIKCTESYWYTVGQKGDTTYYSQLVEETNQDDPNEKPKYNINGAGYIVKEQPKVKAPINTISAPVIKQVAPVKSIHDTMMIVLKVKGKPVVKNRNPNR